MNEGIKVPVMSDFDAWMYAHEGIIVFIVFVIVSLFFIFKLINISKVEK